MFQCSWIFNKNVLSERNRTSSVRTLKKCSVGTERSLVPWPIFNNFLENGLSRKSLKFWQDFYVVHQIYKKCIRHIKSRRIFYNKFVWCLQCRWNETTSIKLLFSGLDQLLVTMGCPKHKTKQKKLPHQHRVKILKSIWRQLSLK